MASSSNSAAESSTANAESSAATAESSTANAEIADRISKTVILVSSDKIEFQVSQSAAVLSAMLRNTIEDCGGNSISIPIPNVDGKTLSQVTEYLIAYSCVANLPVKEREKCNAEYLRSRTLDDLFELITAANYLNIQVMIDLVADEIARKIKNKSVTWIREKFKIVNHLTPEEENEITQTYDWAHEGVEDDN